MDTSQDNVFKTISAQILFTLLCTFVYYYFFKLNSAIFGWLDFSHGVNWVFLPSGLRLLFVLVLLNPGAYGIALASCLINYENGPPDQHLFYWVTGLISGFAPLAARYVCVDFLSLNKDLANLTGKMHLQISVVFALMSALLHQVWYFWNGVTHNFIASAAVMALGDWLGTVLVLAVAALVIKIYRRLA